MGNYDYDDKSMVHKAKYMPDIHAALHNLYVYSNIVKHTLVGNEYLYVYSNIVKHTLVGNEYLYVYSNIAKHTLVGNEYLYMYSNIVKHTLVGNEYFPLLRIIDASGQHGSNVYKSFQNPFYMELKYDRIASIRISLCDDQGDIVKLTSGKVICILHFRRKTGVGL